MRGLIEVRALSFILLVAAFLASRPILAAPARPLLEPSYQGLSLYEWLSYYDDTDRSFPLRERAYQKVAWEEALKKPIAAVRQIGTNAIPSLLAWIESSTNDLSTDGTPYRARLAVVGFGILGAGAQPACPILARLAADSRQKVVARNALEALINIGPGAVSELVSILVNTNAPEREKAAEAIGSFGTNGLPAVPALLQRVSDTDELVAAFAAVALTELPVRQDVVLPALTNVLNDPRPMVRWAFVRSLSWHSPKPDVAATALSHALSDTSPDVRREAIVVLAELRTRPESVLPILTNSVNDPNPDVRTAATNAITRLSGSGHTLKP